MTIPDPSGVPPPPTPPTPTPVPPPPPNPAPPSPPAPPAPPTLGPAEVQAAATDMVAKQLGVSLDDAKKLIKRQQDADKAQMTEAERAAAESKAATDKATAAQAEAAQTTHTAKVTVALVRAGVHPDKLEWAARLVGAHVGADDAGITAAIMLAKTAVPEVFTGAAPTSPPPPVPGAPPSSNPPGSPPPPQPPVDAKKKASERIARMFPHAVEKAS